MIDDIRKQLLTININTYQIHHSYLLFILFQFHTDTLEIHDGQLNLRRVNVKTRHYTVLLKGMGSTLRAPHWEADLIANWIQVLPIMANYGQYVEIMSFMI